MKKLLLVIFLVMFIMGANVSYAVNAPVIRTGEMVPIKWDSTYNFWITTTEDDPDWYNYNSVATVTNNVIGGNGDGKWANVMTYDGLSYYESGNSGTTVTPTVGTEIPAGKVIATQGSGYVWIPRYSYDIVNGENGGIITEGNGGDIESIYSWNSEAYQEYLEYGYVEEGDFTEEYRGEIAIRFSEGTTDYTEGEYKVHPAFNFGTDVKLEGFWVAKYEASKGTNTVTNEVVNVPSSEKYVAQFIPLVSSWRNETISNQFLYAYNTYRNADSHMMKNTEWGAVAYLNNAIGKIPYGNHDGFNYKTGIGGNVEGYNMASSAPSVARYGWNKKIGIHASTTHNVYGIYDMHGGSWDSVAAYLEGTSNTHVAVLETYDEKYRDVYSANADGSIDLTSVTGDAVYETSKWDKRMENNPTSSSPFFSRGNNYITNSILSYDARNGIAGNNTFRVVLSIPKYTIEVTQGENGTISPETSIVIGGDNVEFTITPEDGYEISELLVDGVSQEITNSFGMVYTFSNVTSNHTITTIFGEYNMGTPNAPVVRKGEMVPVYWDGTKGEYGSWITTTEDDPNWYNYNSVAQATHSTVDGNGDGKWANVMTYDGLTYYNEGDSGDTTTAVVGDIIPAGKVIATQGSQYVWIPRYSYMIVSGEHQYSSYEGRGRIFYDSMKSWNSLDYPGTDEDENKAKIVVKFSNKTIDYTQNGYKAHPTFNFGTNEKGEIVKLEGIWVSKYASSKGANSVTNQSVDIPSSERYVAQSIPEVSMWSSESISNFFNYAYNTYRKADSHMMKNTEWGAVAYLTNAIGRIPYPNNDGFDFMTGISADGQNYNYATSRPDYLHYWNERYGVKASTTHNIYGVYDMSGGGWEYTAAYIEGASNSYISTLEGADEKYTDIYEMDENGNVDLTGIIGDAIYETIGEVEGTLYAWDNDYIILPTSTSPFFVRGANYAGAAKTGIFATIGDSGKLTSASAFRVVLSIPKYTIEVTQGSNGTISPETTEVLGGSTQSFTITPAAGYSISSVVVDGVSQEITNYNQMTYTFSNVAANHTITATFVNGYTITVTQGENGTISPETTIVQVNQSETFTITPNSGYEIESVTIDGSSQTVTDKTGMTYTFNNVASNHTITATFVKVPAIILKWEKTDSLEGTISVNMPTSATKIDWGDGTVEDIITTNSNEVNLTHTYDEPGTYTVKILDDVVTALKCKESNIIELDVTRNTKLTSLVCSDNKISKLDVSNNTNLATLWFENNQISEIDVSNNIKLTYILGNNNNLSELDLSQNVNLVNLYCKDNLLSELDLSQNVKLTTVYCENNKLSELTLPQSTSLTSLTCDNNELSELDVSGNTALSTLHCNDNKITKLELDNNANLKYVYCENNKLTELDVSNKPNLRYVYCENNQLSKLNVTNNTSLTELYCNNNKLTELDVSTNTSLSEFYCHDNNLTTLDVSNKTNLTRLYCNNNSISNLNISNDTKLTTLYCDYNKLSELDISTNTKLSTLNCNNNNLSELNVKGITSLRYIHCSNNNLNELDVSGISNLWDVYCSNNNIKELNLINNSVISRVCCVQESLEKIYLTPRQQLKITVLEDCNGCDSISTGSIFHKHPDTVVTTAPNITVEDNGDGSVKLVGLTTSMQYNTTSADYTGTWTKYTAGALQNITSGGTYYIRLSSVSVTSNGVTTVIDPGEVIEVALCKITVISGSNGSITPTTCVVEKGTSPQFRIISNEGYKIESVKKGTVRLGAVRNGEDIEITDELDMTYVMNNITADIGIQATFVKCHEIEVTQGENGTITPGIALVTEGGNKEFTITPNTGYKIDSVIVDGVSQEITDYNQMTYTFSNVTEKHTITATFVNGYTIQVTQGENGTITPETTIVQANQSTTFTIMPNSGYWISSLVVDGEKQKVTDPLGMSYTFSNVTANHTITATYYEEPQVVFKWNVKDNLNVTVDVYTSAVSKIDWGDGRIESFGSDMPQAHTMTHTYLEAGVYEVRLLQVHEELHISGQNVFELDVSRAIWIHTLDCSDNDLTTLNVSSNTNLTTLNCSNNKLTALDISNNTRLWNLNCSGNNLSTLNVSQNTQLNYLYCNDNNLNSLNVSNNTTLWTLECANNNLATLDVSNNTNITTLDCGGNNLGVLDVSKNTSLQTLYCSDNNLKELSVRSNGNLKKLCCAQEIMEKLYITKAQQDSMTIINCTGCNNITNNNVIHKHANTIATTAPSVYAEDNGDGTVKIVGMDTTMVYNTVSSDYAGAWTTYVAGTLQNISVGGTYYVRLSAGGDVTTVNVYEITIERGENGLISPRKNIVTAGGIDSTLEIEPIGGYIIGEILVDGVNHYITDELEMTYTFSNISASHTISVTFENNMGIPNAPVVRKGEMVPIKWDRTKGEYGSWVTTTEDDPDWYDYNSIALADDEDWVEQSGGNGNGKWANVMTYDGLSYYENGISGATVTPNVGTEIPSGKVIATQGSQYVWIPRYSYKVNGGSGVRSWNCDSYVEAYKDGRRGTEFNISGGQIVIKFSEGIIDYTEGEFKEHPAFNFGTDVKGEEVELEGIWVAKYEASKGTNTVTNEVVDIPSSEKYVAQFIPTVPSWRNETVSNQFIYAYNTYRNADSHMMKNTEWGAVAYLANAIGKIPAANQDAYTYLTGIGSCGIMSAPNDGYYWDYEGVYASTTHTVYGIYDMHGGSWENVSAYLEGTSNTHVAVLETYDEKYRDVYSANADGSIDLTSITGDAVYETSNWDQRMENSPTSSLPFFTRGNNYIATSMFSYNGSNGNAGNNTFRVVLSIPKYTIEVTQGENGTITPGTTKVVSGYNKSFTIKPSTGYKIASLVVDGVSQKITNYNQMTYTFSNVRENHTITATFVNGYTIEVTQEENGTITPETTIVQANQSETFTITPNSGYWISSLVVDGEKQKVTDPLGMSYTFSNVTANHTITATYYEEPQVVFKWNVKDNLNVTVDVYTSAVSQIDWGDGTIESFGSDMPAADSMSHRYLEPGIYEVRLLQVYEELYISGQNVFELDVSRAVWIHTLDCSDNDLTTLNVSSNTNLTTLNCSNNKLTALDISNNTRLWNLNCSGNNLSTLNVSQNTNLMTLNCSNNNLSTLDVSNNGNLSTLQCANNNLTTLDVSNNTSLITLDCGGNNLGVLDVSKNTSLQTLYCSDNNLKELSVRSNGNLKKLCCAQEIMEKLYITKAQQDNMTIIDCTGCNNITNNNVIHKHANTIATTAPSVYAEDNGDGTVKIVGMDTTMVYNTESSDYAGAWETYTAGDLDVIEEGGTYYIRLASGGEVATVNVYEITITCGENGTISPSENIITAGGIDATLEIEPIGGYIIGEILVDGVNHYITDELEMTYTFSNISASHTISVTFENNMGIPNAPVVRIGEMVPIKWDSTYNFWVTTTEDDPDWYNYNSVATVENSVIGGNGNGKWANVMTYDGLTYYESGNSGTTVTPTVGTEIPSGKVIATQGSVYVWIPRYSYDIVNGENGGETGEIYSWNSETYKEFLDWDDFTEENRGQIVIKFSEGTTDYTEGEYKEHPAFNFGTDVKLEGFWVAKYEASSGTNTVTNEVVDVPSSEKYVAQFIPSVPSWRNETISDQFIYAYNTYRNADSHMMKNTEWGAVAYLNNAIGKALYPNHDGIKYKTGIGASSENATFASSAPGLIYSWNRKNGIHASTTHNVYGIYDMKGGSWESVSAYLDGTSNTHVEILETYDEKYRDVYSKNGDGSIDLTSVTGDAVYETSNWDNRMENNPTSSLPFFARGNNFISTSMLSYMGSNGNANSSQTFRVVLSIPKYTIEVTQGENGTITPGTTKVVSGYSKSFTIKPSTGYKIASLVVDGVSQEITNYNQMTYTFSNVAANHTITATFVNGYTIQVTQGENGTITPATTIVQANQSETFTITPSTGYWISSLVVDGEKQKVTDPLGMSYTFSNVTANHTITATYYEEPQVVFKWNVKDNLNVTVNVYTSAVSKIDWGDGTIESFGSDMPQAHTMTHTYLEAGVYEVRLLQVHEELHISGQNIFELDVSRAIWIHTLDCSDNDLTTLNVSSNTNLTTLNCSNNKLTALDISNNTRLWNLNCSGNNLSTLNVSQNTQLNYLYCNDNNLNSLNVSNNTTLWTLECANNNLTTLNVSSNTSLSTLKCSGNSLATIDVSNNTSLRILDCGGNNLSVLDVSKNTSLQTLYCSNNSLKELSIRSNPNLKKLCCSQQIMEKLYITKAQQDSMTIINCEGCNNITSENVIHKHANTIATTALNVYAEDNGDGTVKIVGLDTTMVYNTVSSDYAGAWTTYVAGTLQNISVGGTYYVRLSAGGDVTTVNVYEIEIECGETGTISPSENIITAGGIDRILTISPIGGYKIASILVDGVNVEIVNELGMQYTFNDIDASHTISVTFENNMGIPNAPVVRKGEMVPVKWDSTYDFWVTTTEDDPDWYGYSGIVEGIDNAKWANVMTYDGLTYYENGNSGATVTPVVGEILPEGKVIATQGSQYVWIPRYSYNIVNGENGGNVDRIYSWTSGKYYLLLTMGMITEENKGQIVIKFSEGTTDYTEGEFKEHPAFNFGTDVKGEEVKLEGIWVAKYEASQGTNTVTNEVVDIPSSEKYVAQFIPLVPSWRYETVSDQFIYAYNTYRNADSHMMKNTEWGAVAYLANAIGWMPERNGDIVTNLTGIGPCGNMSAPSEAYYWNKTNGISASTTYSVYGIYDMGGKNEDTVAAYLDGTSNTHVSVLETYDEKYRDVYSANGDGSIDLTSITGDAVYETSKWDEREETNPTSSSPFFVRYGNDAMLSYNNSDGNGNYYKAFRAVLSIPKYTVKVVQGVNGIISPETKKVIAGTNPRFRITPNEGYRISSILVDGVSQEITNELGMTYTFNNINANYTITAVYEKIQGMSWSWDTTDDLTKNIFVKTNGQGIIDWGDGTTSNILSSSSKLEIIHEYDMEGTYDVKIINDVVTYLDLSNESVTNANFTNANNLKELFIYNNSLSKVNVNTLTKVVVDDEVTVTGTVNKVLKVGTVGNGTFTVSDDLIITFTTASIYQITEMTLNDSVISIVNPYNASSLAGTNTIIATFETFTGIVEEEYSSYWEWSVYNGLTRIIKAKVSQDTLIFWGDGSYDVVLSGATRTLTHAYDSSGVYKAGFKDIAVIELDISDSDVTTINIASDTDLEKLNVSDNSLDYIDLTNNTNLVQLNANNNNLTTIDLSLNTNLKGVEVNNNKLISLNISSSSPLKYLDVSNNNFTTLNVSSYSLLETLKCSDNGMNTLNLGAIGSLRVLDVSNNNLTSINNSNNRNLKELYCNSNNLTGLNVGNNTALEILNCENNLITSLNVTNLLKLTEIRSFNNSLSTLNLLNNNELDLAIVDLNCTVSIDEGINILRVKAEGNGKIDTYGYVTARFIPNSGYTIQKITLNGVLQPINMILTLDNYNGDNTLIVWFTEGEMDSNQVLVNMPNLLDGMIPVKWNGSNWIITTLGDYEWYDYSSSNKKWANVMLRDGAKYMNNGTPTDIGTTALSDLKGMVVDSSNMGSMFVWIPRFSYDIDGTNISVKFSEGIEDYTDDGYILHPAFNFASYNGGNTSVSTSYENGLTPNDKLLGFWAPKYSATDNSGKIAVNNGSEWVNITINDAFVNSKDMLLSNLSDYGITVDSDVTLYNSHLMKNVEWGAISYLAMAIGSNSATSDSTTGNNTGIYGMNSGMEFVASYIELVGGISNANVREYGENLLDYELEGYTPDEDNIKYVDKLKLTSPNDTESSNELRLEEYYGTGTTELNGDANVPNKENAFFARGDNGIFDYDGVEGNASADISFRPTILAEVSASSIKTRKITATASAYGRISPLGVSTVVDGGSQKYIITPDSGAELVDVKVNGASVLGSLVTVSGNTKSYTFTNVTTRDHVINAIFDIPVAEYSVDVSVEGNGRVSGMGIYESREMVTLKANPYYGYTFDGWDVIGNSVSLNDVNSEEITFTMPSNNVTLVAKFKEKAVAIYSETDNSLTFIRSSEDFNVGDTYNGKAVTAVYTGFETDVYSQVTQLPWYDNRNTITSVIFEDEIKPVSTKYWFNGFKVLTEIDLKKLNTSKVTTMHSMFGDCIKITTIDVRNFDTSKVTTMQAMFSRCTRLVALDLSNFDTSNVTNMSFMFNGDSKLTEINFSGLDTSKVTAMDSMFSGCGNLKNVNMSGLDLRNVTNMELMFSGCSRLTTLNLTGTCTKRVMRMNEMFSGCTGLVALDLSNFDTSNVSGMKKMFYNCSSLTKLDLSNFNTSKVTNMQYMFYGCNSLTKLDISNFDTSNVTNVSQMFYNCRNLTLDCSSWNVSKVTSHSSFNTNAPGVIAPW